MNGVTAQNHAIKAQHFVQENSVEVGRVQDTPLKQNYAMSKSVQVLLKKSFTGVSAFELLIIFLSKLHLKYFFSLKLRIQYLCVKQD